MTNETMGPDSTVDEHKGLVPEPGNDGAQPAALDGETGQPPAAGLEVQGEDQAGSDDQTYTVGAGDTLSDIAQRYYGDASAYTRIWEANRDKLDNPDVIQPGQELTIPR